MSKPRILIIENSVDVTGSLISALRSSNALRDKFDFTIMIPKGSSAAERIRKNNFEIIEFPMLEIRRNAMTLLMYVPVLLINAVRFFSVVRRVAPALIVSNDFYNMLPPLYKIFGGKIPYVCFIRFLPSHLPKALVRMWLAAHNKYSSTVIVVSDAVMHQLNANRKYIKVNDPLPAEEVPFSYNSDSQTILCLANYIKGKGQEHVLQAFAKVHASFPGWHLRFAGSDMGLEKNRAFKNSLMREAKTLGINEKVEWHDVVTDLAGAYATSAFTVNFSESESFSLTCLESLFAGRPVIATRSGGPAEIIDENVTGYLVPLRDTSEMARAMQRLMGDTDVRRKMAEQAYQTIRKKFAAQMTSDKLAGVYFPLVERYKPI